MTKEETINMLKAKRDCNSRKTSGVDEMCNSGKCTDCSLMYEQGNMGEQREALDMIIKVLEQCEGKITGNYWKGFNNGIRTQKFRESKIEPCEDCVSRQAVDTLVDELARAISDERCCMSRGRSTATIMQDILDLPPVTPQSKLGHWIDVETLDSALWHACSECGETEFYATDYCPNCGAKMAEPQESEDKE